MRSVGGVMDAVDGAKRTEALLRDARSALRRVDRLAAQALVMEDDSASLITEARSLLDHAVRTLTQQRQGELRRARAAVRSAAGPSRSLSVAGGEGDDA